MEKFSFKRDFKSIDWGSTLYLNFVRSLAAGIVWFIISALTHNITFSLLLFPIVYFVILLPVGIIAGKMSEKGVQFAGLFAMFISLLVAVGDPVVFILHKFKPEFVPVKDFNFISLKIVIFVVKDKDSNMNNLADTIDDSNRGYSTEPHIVDTGVKENQNKEDFSGNLRTALNKEKELIQPSKEDVVAEGSEGDIIEYMRVLANEEPDKCLDLISKLIENDALMALNPLVLFFRGFSNIQKGAQLFQVQNEWTDEILNLFEQSLLDFRKSDEIDPKPAIFEGAFKEKIDSVALVLNGKRPGIVQQLLGRTKLKYMLGGESRVFINDKCAEFLRPSEKAMEIFGDVFFSFPSIVMSVFVAYMQKDDRNKHYIKVALCEEPSLLDAFGEPHEIRGYIDIFEDGTYKIEDEKKR